MGLFKTSVLSLKVLRRLERFYFKRAWKKHHSKVFVFNEAELLNYFLFKKICKDLCMQSSVFIVNAYCQCWGAYMSDVVLNFLCLWSHLIFTTVLEDRPSYYIHLTEEETEVTVTCLRVGALIWTRSSDSKGLVLWCLLVTIMELPKEYSPVFICSVKNVSYFMCLSTIVLIQIRANTYSALMCWVLFLAFYVHFLHNPQNNYRSSLLSLFHNGRLSDQEGLSCPYSLLMSKCSRLFTAVVCYRAVTSCHQCLKETWKSLKHGFFIISPSWVELLSTLPFYFQGLKYSHFSLKFFQQQI